MMVRVFAPTVSDEEARELSEGLVGCRNSRDHGGVSELELLACGQRDGVDTC